MERVKALAEQLGFLQTITLKPLGHVETGFCVFKDESQTFDFVIVIDFESTCWDADNRKQSRQNLPEVIEFPAVLFHLASCKIEDEFHHYVMPVENPKLSDFCMNLTGIKQEQVDSGMPLSTCIFLFSQWIEKISNQYKLSFHKHSPGQKACTFITWSDWDLAVCLQNEIQRKQIRRLDVLTQWIDLRATYRQFYKRRPQGLRGALAEVGIPFTGREHSGIVDARNTALLAHRMVKDGCELKITGSLKPKSGLIASSRSEDGRNGKTAPLRKHEVNLRKPLTTVLKTSQTPLKAVNRRDAESHNGLKDVFQETPRRTAVPTSKVTPLCKHLGKVAGPWKTPDRKIQPSSSCKRTPPLCRCGRRAVCKVANSPGPNQGRCFFSCANNRRSLGLVSKVGCNFFLWC